MADRDDSVEDYNLDFIDDESVKGKKVKISLILIQHLMSTDKKKGDLLEGMKTIKKYR